jgi:putative sigma-54 modulation protein
MTRAEVKEKFSGHEYPIHVIGRHVDITPPMKAYAVEKLTKAKRFGGRIVEATITMDVQKLSHTVDFILNVNNARVKVSATSDNMYASVDQAVAKLESKLRKYMGRLHEHNAKGISEIEMNVNVIEGPQNIDEINDQIEEENLRALATKARHQVVTTEKKRMKTLSQSEAILSIELSNDFFVVYKSEEDHKIKVLYRRNDGNYGIIEPQA